MPTELQRLIEEARKVTMSPDEKEAQRISFAYGNARLSNENVTLEDILQASQRLKDRRDEPSAGGS